MIRIIYFADLLPGTSRQDFVQRWIRHGDLAAECRGFFDPVVHYVQADGIGAGGPDGSLGIDHLTDYAAVGELGYADEAGCMASMTSAELGEVIGPDGDLMFGRDRWKCIAADCRTIREGQASGFKLYVLILPQEGASDVDVNAIETLMVDHGAGAVSVGTPAAVALPLDAFVAIVDAGFEDEATMLAAARNVDAELGLGSNGVIVMTRPRQMYP